MGEIRTRSTGGVVHGTSNSFVIWDRTEVIDPYATHAKDEPDVAHEFFNGLTFPPISVTHAYPPSPEYLGEGVGVPRVFL